MKIWAEREDLLPEQGSAGAAGLDLRVKEDCLVSAAKVSVIGTGVKVAIPEGYVGLVVVRSSAGVRGLRLANQVGVIDSDYRGEIKLALIADYGTEYLTLKDGDRVAQLLIMPVESVVLDIVANETDLGDTDRGDGGFGSTGD